MTTAVTNPANINMPTRCLGAAAGGIPARQTSNEIGAGEDIKPKSSGPVVEGQIKVLQIIECAEDLISCRYHKEGTVLAVGMLEGSVKIYDPDSGKVLYSLVDNDTKTARLPVTSMKFRPVEDDQKIEHQKYILTTYASGLVKMWHYSSGSCLETINEDRQTLAADFSPDGNRFVTGGDSVEIPIYDTTTMKRVRTVQPSDSRNIMNGHRSRVFAIQYHPLMSRVFISGGWDGTVQFWDEREQHSIRKISGDNGPHICGEAMDIDPIHNHIVTGSWRTKSTLQIWDFASGDKIKDVPQDTLQHSQLYCAQWLGKEMISCGGSDNNMARIIDRGTLNTIGQLVDLPQGVYCMDNTRVGNNPKVACGSKNAVYIIRQDKI